MTNRCTRYARLTLLALLAATISAAEDLRIAGVAKDQSGATIGQALVELSGEYGLQRTRTEANGTFAIEPVDPGAYLLSVSTPDFEPCVQEVILSDSPIEIECVLALALQTQSVEVVATDTPIESTDPDDNASRVEISGADLQRLPALDGDIVGALQGLLGGGSFGSESGGMVVDGMETTDIGVSPSAIQEIRINKDPYSSEFSRPGRSRIEIITKKGAENIHGQLNLRVRNYLLDARNAFADERADQRRFAVEGHLVGPIGKGGRHSFVLSGEHDRDRQAKTIYATALEGTFQQAILAPEIETEISGRWEYHPSYEQAFSLRYGHKRESEKNNGVGGFSLPEVASDSRESGHDVRWNYRKVFGPSSLLNWTGRIGQRNGSDWSLNDSPRLIVQDAFTSGGAQRDSRNERLYVESAGVFSYQKGAHSLRMGVLLRDLDRMRSVDRNNFGGTYRFATLADYEAGRPLSYSFRSGDPTLKFWNVAVAGFIQDNIRVNQRSTLAVGVRYDRQQYGADPNNIAPRASFAVNLGSNRRTTIRVGGGIFYDNVGSGAYQDRLRFDGIRLREFLLSNPSYPDPSSTPGNGDALAPNLVTWAPNLATPYIGQYSAGVERRLTDAAVLSVTWTNSVGVGLLRSRDLNAPLPNLAVRPDTAVGIHRQLEASARQEIYNLNAQLRGRLNEFFQGTIRYNWGRAYNDVARDSSLPADSRDLSREWGPAGFDRQHRLDLVGSFDVKNWFQLGLILEVDSAAPYTLTTGQDDNGDGLTGDRPLNIGRNTERGAPKSEFDVRFSKTIKMPPLKASGGDATNLALTIDAFNLLNTVNPRNFIGNMSSPLFGQPTSAGAARRLQVGLRWSF
jgi:hypothetical protein